MGHGFPLENIPAMPGRVSAKGQPGLRDQNPVSGSRHCRLSTSGEKVFYNLPVHIRQTKMPALVFEGQFGVVNSQVFEDGSVQVMHVDGILDDVVAVVVGFSVGYAWLESFTRQPHGEAARMVVATIIGISQAALTVDGKLKL